MGQGEEVAESGGTGSGASWKNVVPSGQRGLGGKPVKVILFSSPLGFRSGLTC